MLWIVSAVLIALWVTGMITAHTLGGYIHFLLVVAVIFVLVRIIRGHKAV